MRIERRAALIALLALLMALLLAVMPVAGAEAASEDAAGAEASEDAAGAETTGEAEATGWREGMGPGKPYAGVPEVDLSEQLGYMVFCPTQAMSVENSCQKLFVYLPRTDVKAGEGMLYLASEEDGEIWRTAMNNEEAVKQRAASAGELKSLMWGGGSCFEITLPKSLELGKTYFVNMERGCIWTEDGKLDNPEVGGTEAWRFTLGGEYGVSSMEYRRPIAEVEAEATASPEPGSEEEAAAEAARLEAAIALANGAEPEPEAEPEIEYEPGILHPRSGDEIRFDLTIGGEAAMAVVYGYNGTVDFPEVTFTQSREVRGQVLAENPAWGVIFLDAQGNELHRLEFR